MWPLSRPNSISLLTVVSATLEGLEALQGDSGGAGDKLQQPRAPLFVVRLHGAPEPLNNVAVGRAVLQAGVGLPVVNVYLPQATHYELDVGGRGERSRKKRRDENTDKNITEVNVIFVLTFEQKLYSTHVKIKNT